MGAAPSSPHELLADLQRRPLRPVEGEGPEVTRQVNDLLASLRTGPTGESAELLDGTFELLRTGHLEGALTKDLDVESLAAMGEALADALESEPGDQASLRPRAWAWLDVVRRRAVLRAVSAASAVDRFMELVTRLIDASRFTVARLLEQRIERYGPRIVFRELRHGDEIAHSWTELGADVGRVARGLLALEAEQGPGPVAILSENRYEMVVVDLACLTTGLVNAMIPANATETDVAYVLEKIAARTAVVSTREQLRKVERARPDLPELRSVVVFDTDVERATGRLRLGDVIARADDVAAGDLAARREIVAAGDHASVMFTSGTTGRPKGIVFSQRNIVSKRFARALALPELGDQDVFLCYLPLCHTFGRYLEMMGCLFWGATYVFLEDASSDALLDGLRRVRPTVFISIPQRWIQLWEEIGRKADLERGEDEEIASATREVIGDRLSWGLSAAGYLDPDIFRFFQAQGVELMSGFGMTEGTGGITMTPPGGYQEDSLGVPLPGIEAKLADDGELLVRGPYVMEGYFGEEPGTGFTADGWMRTGDLMRLDEKGHFRLVDRKKEIYKNVKGQSIAPQRIENLFRDFEAVKRVFLVGDHRPYNTVLFVPNPESVAVDLGTMEDEEKRDYFRSLVVSVNRFLSPFERIVDFAVLDRDLEEGRGELTPKGTYRRKTVVENFEEVIAGLYRRAHLRLPGLEIEIRIPNWIFQALGLTARDLRADGNRIVLTGAGLPLLVQASGETDDGPVVRIGSCRYVALGRAVDLGDLLATPSLWMGNEELVRFASLESAARTRRRRPPRDLRLLGRAVAYVPDETALAALREAAGRKTHTLDDLDLAARLLGSDDDAAGLLAVRVIDAVLRAEEGPLTEPALLALRSAADSPSPTVRRHAFRVLLPAEREHHVAATLERFLAPPEALLDEETIALLCAEDLSDTTLGALVRFAQDAAVRRCGEIGDREARRAWVDSLVQALGEYGAAHPGKYRELRTALTRIRAFAPGGDECDAAALAFERMREGFRAWLGAIRKVAVDPEDGREYRWDDVVTFEEGTDPGDRERLAAALADSNFLREAIFLLSSGAMVRLSDIPPQGVWVSLLGERHGKAVYRVTVHTRHQGSFDLAANLNQSLSHEDVLSEIQWLVITGETPGRPPLVESFGGYWGEHDLWSEEFVAGETLDRVLRRLARSDGEEGERIHNLWPFFVWSAAAAYIDFWERTGRRVVIADPSPENVIVPTHDYQTSARVVSIAHREIFPELATMMSALWRALVESPEADHATLEGLAAPRLLMAALLEVVGTDDGCGLLAGVGEWGAPFGGEVETFLDRVREDGFAPRRLRFAIERFRRWALLAPEATPEARAATLRELYDTYGLTNLLAEYPDARVRFFRDTVFREAAEPVVSGLTRVMRTLRGRAVEPEETLELLGDLRRHMTSGSAEEYFLARLSYPHLRPGDRAGFLSSDQGGVRQTDIVVTLQDHDGHSFQVRHPVSPKEVARLHRLFLSAKLEVAFRPEHHYLVAVGERGQLVGGLFYEVDEEEGAAHLEKIVVAERFRKLGVSDGLMNEMFNRLRGGGIQQVTTGYFRPGYFYRFGFSVEKRYAGLVKMLTPES